jgi:hypothetical protein
MKKNLAISKLIELKKIYHREKYPNLPEHCMPEVKYSDNSANNLTKCIIHYLELLGHSAERINVQGRRVDKTEIVENILGNKKQIGSVKWQKSTGKVGRADIHAKIKHNKYKFAIPIEIEVKYGKDRQSEKQKNFQLEMENIGTPYFIAKTFEEFYHWYNDWYDAL